MRFTYNYLVNTLLWIFLLSTSLVESCNLSAVNQCVALLNTTESTKGLTEGMAAIPPTGVLVSLCRFHPDFKACYDPFAVTCKNNPGFSMTFGVIDATLSYLCTEGYNEILQHENCWKETDFISGTLLCHVQQNETIVKLELLTETMDITTIKNNWCSMLQNMSDCMTDVTAINCGPTPACIVRTMMLRASAGFAELMGCSMKSDCSDIMAVTPLVPDMTSSVNVTLRNSITEGNRDKTTDTTGTGASSSTSLINMTLIVVLYIVQSDILALVLCR